MPDTANISLTPKEQQVLQTMGFQYSDYRVGSFLRVIEVTGISRGEIAMYLKRFTDLGYIERGPVQGSYVSYRLTGKPFKQAAGE